MFLAGTLNNKDDPVQNFTLPTDEYKYRLFVVFGPDGIPFILNTSDTKT